MNAKTTNYFNILATLCAALSMLQCKTFNQPTLSNNRSYEYKNTLLPSDQDPKQELSLLGLLEKEVDDLCHSARKISLDSKVASIDYEFKDLATNLKQVDCMLLRDFIFSPEFDSLFTESLSSISLHSNNTQNEDHFNLAAVELSNPETTPKLLLIMGLVGFISGARMKFIQGDHRQAVFQWIVSTVTLYLGSASADGKVNAVEGTLIPWTLFINGAMGASGAIKVIVDGYRKARKWTYREASYQDYDAFKKFYNERMGSSKSTTLSWKDIKMDDDAIVRIAQKVKMEPQEIKRLVGGAVVLTGIGMATFAIQQLVVGSQELKKVYELAGEKKMTYRSMYEKKVANILYLKSQINLCRKQGASTPSLSPCS